MFFLILNNRFYEKIFFEAGWVSRIRLSYIELTTGPAPHRSTPAGAYFVKARCSVRYFWKFVAWCGGGFWMSENSVGSATRVECRNTTYGYHNENDLGIILEQFYFLVLYFVILEILLFIIFLYLFIKKS